MSAPTYSTDLADISTCEAVGTWVEPSATGWTAGGTPAVDGENYIQNTYAISKAFNATGVGGMIFDYGSGLTITSPAAVFIWIYWASPQTLESYANGGMRVMVGSGQAAFYSWDVSGKDLYPYGGWINVAVDPSVTVDDTAGSPTTTKQWFGYAVNNTNNISKGSPQLCDVVRYGRQLKVINGDGTNGYGTFAGAAAKNDANDGTNGYNRWGLFQAIAGGYLMKGQFQMGDTGTAVDFRDSNRNIAIQDSKKVASTFNEFKVVNASSRMDWTAITISSLCSASRCNFTNADNATVNITNCVFNDMGTFQFGSNSTVDNTTFRRCNLVTQDDADITNSTFDSTNDSTKALLSDAPDLLDGCTFVSSGTKHAIELTTACAGNTYTLTNVTFTGYASIDGSTGNECIYNNSNGAVTLNISGGTLPTIKNGSGASTTVVSNIALTINGLVAGSDVVVYEAGTTTVLDDVQENSDSDWDYVYTAADVGEDIDIGVFKSGYVPFYIRGYTLGGSNSSVPVAQVVDRAYLV